MLNVRSRSRNGLKCNRTITRRWMSGQHPKEHSLAYLISFSATIAVCFVGLFAEEVTGDIWMCRVMMFLKYGIGSRLETEQVPDMTQTKVSDQQSWDLRRKDGDAQDVSQCSATAAPPHTRFCILRQKLLMWSLWDLTGSFLSKEVWQITNSSFLSAYCANLNIMIFLKTKLCTRTEPRHFQNSWKFEVMETDPQSWEGILNSVDDFMEDLKHLAMESGEKVKEKVLELVQCWAHAFRSKTQYKIVLDTHNFMKLEGFEFPTMREADAMFSAESAPDWMDGDACYRCRAGFGVWTRKHHCRAFGQIFCDTRQAVEALREEHERRRQEELMEAEEKVLELVQCWAHAFRSKTQYKIFLDTHNFMKLEGFEFPTMREADAMFSAESAPDWMDGDACYGFCPSTDDSPRTGYERPPASATDTQQSSPSDSPGTETGRPPHLF